MYVVGARPSSALLQCVVQEKVTGGQLAATCRCLGEKLWPYLAAQGTGKWPWVPAL